MDLKETNQFSTQDEMNHWWIKTRFLYLADLFDQYHHPVKVLEVGCGTCNNLIYLRMHHSDKISQLTGVDSSIPLNFNRPVELLEHDRIQIELPQKDQFDVVILMDVLEHIKEPTHFLTQLENLMHPQSQLFVTVPAFNFLYSKHDEYLGHYRRYTKQSLIATFEKRYITEKCHYVFSWAVPIVYILRKVLFPNGMGQELKKTNALINLLFYQLGVIEKRIPILASFFGTSVMGTFRRK